MFLLGVLMATVATSFGAYNAAKPADNEYVADVPALVRENFRAIKDDAIVNAGTVAGLSVGNASGNIPRSNGTLNTNLNADLLDGYHASAFNASDALLLRLDGSRAMTGSLKFSGNYGILRNTSDGADTGYVGACGGGGLDNARGAALFLYGNEESSYGGVARYYAGNVSTGDHVFYTGAGTERFRIAYDGSSQFSGSVGIGADAYPFRLRSEVGVTTAYGAGAPDASNCQLGLTNAATAGTSSGIQFNISGDSKNRIGYIGAISHGTSNRYLSLVFCTDNGTNRNEGMRLTYNRNFLIGTTTDDGTNKLQVNGSAYAQRFVVPNDYGYRCINSSGGLVDMMFLSSANVSTFGSAGYAARILSNGTLTHNGNTVWTSGNDGAGSGLDADTLDTKHASDFATAAQGTKADNALPSSSYTASDVLTKIKTVDGSGSGLDADTVDGYAPSTSGTANTLVLRDSYGCFNVGNTTNGIGLNSYCSSIGSLRMALYGQCGDTSAGLSGSGVMGVSDASGGRGVVGMGPSGGYDFYAYGSGTDYGTSSSIRWKKNRKPIQNALGIVDKLEGLRFTWDKEHGGNPGVGFIAEEVGKYLPEIVVWDTKAPGYADGMDYSKMTPLLLQAIKELHAKVQRRTSDNAALLRKIEKQEREIDELKSAIKAIQAKLH